MFIRRIANNRIFRTISAILEIVVTTLLLVLILLSAIQRFSEKGSFFGYRLFTVASGSMIPMYNIGDTLLVKDVPIDDIKIGDAVTYKADSSTGEKVNVTHEVIDVEIDPSTGKYSFHTKGIANNVEDPIVGEEQVVGKVIYCFVILSLIGYVTTNQVLLFTVIGVPFALLVAIEIIKILYGDEPHLMKKVIKRNIKIPSSIDISEFDNKILADDAKRKKIEAIRNGTASVDKNKNLTHGIESKKLSEEELQRKIEAIKSGKNEPVTHNREHSEKQESKEDNKEAINLDAINNIHEEENATPQKEKTLENTMIKNNDEFLETVKLLKAKYQSDSNEYDEKELDDFLEYLKIKLSDEKK